MDISFSIFLFKVIEPSLLRSTASSAQRLPGPHSLSGTGAAAQPAATAASCCRCIGRCLTVAASRATSGAGSLPLRALSIESRHGLPPFMMCVIKAISTPASSCLFDDRFFA